jgi:hypothetical protein
MEKTNQQQHGHSSTLLKSQNKMGNLKENKMTIKRGKRNKGTPPIKMQI